METFFVLLRIIVLPEPAFTFSASSPFSNQTRPPKNNMHMVIIAMTIVNVNSVSKPRPSFHQLLGWENSLTESSSPVKAFQIKPSSRQPLASWDIPHYLKKIGIPCRNPSILPKDFPAYLIASQLNPIIRKLDGDCMDVDRLGKRFLANSSCPEYLSSDQQYCPVSRIRPFLIANLVNQCK